MKIKIERLTVLKEKCPQNIGRTHNERLDGRTRQNLYAPLTLLRHKI